MKNKSTLFCLKSSLILLQEKYLFIDLNTKVDKI